MELRDLNEDWIKTLRWDLPRRFETLVQLVGPEEALALARKELPAGIPMPEDLRQAVLERLA